MSSVSLVKAHRDQIKEALSDALDLIQYDLSQEIKNVVIKPNLCYYWDYTTGQTTDPRFIEALIDLLRDQISSDVKVSIVESDASAMRCEYAFRMLGYSKLAQKNEVDLINLSKDQAAEESVAVNNKNFTFNIPQTVKNADLRINVPKIKYSFSQIGITCALKNVYGCNPYPQKYKFHSTLNEVIVALNKLMKFDLCVLDGIFVSGVQPKKLGLIMSSQDPVAFDAAAAEIAGVNPKSIRYLLLAHKEGLGNLSFIPKGADTNYFREKYPRKKFKNKVMEFGYGLVHTFRLEKRLGLE